MNIQLWWTLQIVLLCSGLFCLPIEDSKSYNNLAHIQEKGWKYLIRIKLHAK